MKQTLTILDSSKLLVSKVLTTLMQGWEGKRLSEISEGRQTDSSHITPGRMLRSFFDAWTESLQCPKHL